MDIINAFIFFALTGLLIKFLINWSATWKFIKTAPSKLNWMVALIITVLIVILLVVAPYLKNGEWPCSYLLEKSIAGAFMILGTVFTMIGLIDKITKDHLKSDWRSRRKLKVINNEEKLKIMHRGIKRTQHEEEIDEHKFILKTGHQVAQQPDESGGSLAYLGLILLFSAITWHTAQDFTAMLNPNFQPAQIEPFLPGFLSFFPECS